MRAGSAPKELLREAGQSQRGQNGERTIGDEKQPGGKAKIVHTRDIVEDKPIHRRGWTQHQQIGNHGNDRKESHMPVLPPAQGRKNGE